MLNYKCLVMDHDDTVVMSTPQVHYPSFRKTLSEIRPDVKMSLEEFMMYCFEPGFYELCFDILHFTQEERVNQYAGWMKYMETHIPDFYPGMAGLIQRQRDEGGIVCVVSHSNSLNIRRDYRKAGVAEPEMVFGWELGEGKRKPSPYPVKMIMDEYKLDESEILVIDDLKPGLDMAEKCGVEFACAGWSHKIKAIEEYMRKNSTHYFASVEELERFCFGRRL
ncbi:MAG: HAD family hydrolase [Bacillota bacterium]|nr:HAD family hydrolase [Bacillota bacterium]